MAETKANGNDRRLRAARPRISRILLDEVDAAVPRERLTDDDASEYIPHAQVIADVSGHRD